MSEASRLEFPAHSFAKRSEIISVLKICRHVALTGFLILYRFQPSQPAAVVGLFIQSFPPPVPPLPETPSALLLLWPAQRWPLAGWNEKLFLFIHPSVMAA